MIESSAGGESANAEAPDEQEPSVDDEPEAADDEAQASDEEKAEA